MGVRLSPVDCGDGRRVRRPLRRLQTIRLAVTQLPIPNFQSPTTSNSQFPRTLKTLNVEDSWKLGVGSGWELVVARRRSSNSRDELRRGLAEARLDLRARRRRRWESPSPRGEVDKTTTRESQTGSRTP